MVVALIALLSAMALPVAKFTVKRQKEAELRLALRQIRTAIDEYKRLSDQGMIPVKIGGEGYPETLEEFVEPDDFPRLNPVETIKRYYLFRRVTDIQDFIERMNKDSEFELPIQRWFKDWQRSSAAEKTLFCQQWVLALREYTDGYGEPRMEVKPMFTYGGAIDELDPDNTTRGSVLANAIHELDRQLGYPMAWYFLSMISACFPLMNWVPRIFFSSN